MLTTEERREIEYEMLHYPDKRALCIEGLKVVQKHRGWISDEAMRDLSEFMNMTADEIDAVATFYNLIYRKPVARHVIMMCDSVSCWVAGYDQLRERLLKTLGLEMGGSTADQRFTLLPIMCLGACGNAPTMMIDGDLHLNVKADEIEQILEKYK